MLRKYLALAFVICAMAGTAFFLSAGNVIAEVPCGKSAEGHQLTRLDDGSGQCADLTPPSPAEQKIISAKQKLALDYAAYKSGKGSKAEVDKDWKEVERLTGVGPFPAGHPLNGGASMGPDGYVGLTSHQQINYYYCGPAMVQNILWYLGPLTSVEYDSVTGQYDSLTGMGSHDQPILANNHWLQTDYYGGTNWGAPSSTINRWAGWQVYTDAWFGGTSNQSTAAYYLQLDTDYGWPDGENVYYNASYSYLPPGFSAGSYWHWDTVYFFDGSTIGIAQSYPSPDVSGTWHPYYSTSWSAGWSAIYYGHGIFW